MKTYQVEVLFCNHAGLTQKMSPCLFIISTLSQPRMKHSFVFSARHDLKQIF